MQDKESPIAKLLRENSCRMLGAILFQSPPSSLYGAGHGLKS
jgi:hypothetical protein